MYRDNSYIPPGALSELDIGLFGLDNLLHLLDILAVLRELRLQLLDAFLLQEQRSLLFSWKFQK